jgi:hypothetical protein
MLSHPPGPPTADVHYAPVVYLNSKSSYCTVSLKYVLTSPLLIIQADVKDPSLFFLFEGYWLNSEM